MSWNHSLREKARADSIGETRFPAAGVCWQKQIKTSETVACPLASEPSKQSAEVRLISYKEARRFILKYEWLGTMPPALRWMFGLYFDGNLAAVECFSEVKAGSQFTLFRIPAICLSRGASISWAPKWAASFLITESLKRLPDEWAFAIAYADTDAGEIGTVYQAANWKCLGRVKNEYWISPEGIRKDREHQRDLVKASPDTTPEKVADAMKSMREQGWRYVKGGARLLYATALGFGRIKKQRQGVLQELAIPFPKRGDDCSRLFLMPRIGGDRVRVKNAFVKYGLPIPEQTHGKPAITLTPWTAQQLL